MKPSSLSVVRHGYIVSPDARDRIDAADRRKRKRMHTLITLMVLAGTASFVLYANQLWVAASVAFVAMGVFSIIAFLFGSSGESEKGLRIAQHRGVTVSTLSRLVVFELYDVTAEQLLTAASAYRTSTNTEDRVNRLQRAVMLTSAQEAELNDLARRMPVERLAIRDALHPGAGATGA